ncbi:MAG: OmpH family outer membrane protein [Cocleimonas sp.]
MLDKIQILQRPFGALRQSILVIMWLSYVSVLLLMSQTSFAKDPISVAVVNVTFLMENAPQSEVASNRLKSRFSPQEKKLAADLEGISKLEDELSKVKSSNVDISIKRKKERELRSLKRLRSRSLLDFREELRFARDTALDAVQKEVFKAIDEVRVLQRIDIVLQDYISASDGVDITPLVLEYLKKKLQENSKLKTETTQ